MKSFIIEKICIIALSIMVCFTKEFLTKFSLRVFNSKIEKFLKITNYILDGVLVDMYN